MKSSPVTTPRAPIRAPSRPVTKSSAVVRASSSPKWNTSIASAPAAPPVLPLGETITINDRPFTIVGMLQYYETEPARKRREAGVPDQAAIRAEQRRSEELQQKLDALRAIDRDMRRPAPRR